ncbi:MAG: peptidase U32 family protein, partial [Verrucomicrobiia bacterium]
MKRRKPELLAPAGDWSCARAAVANGADAIFFGLPAWNARLRAENFRESDLPELMAYLHDRGRKGYLTLNTLVFTKELPGALALLGRAAEAGVDAIIIQDVGLAKLSRECYPGLELHASTQMTLTSAEGLAFAKRLGVARAVVARELSLRELAKLQKSAVLPIETFVHGALCVAYSGQCLTSEVLGQRSANRGECAQACRLPYRLVVDGAIRDLGDRRYLLSPQDLAALREIPELVALGVESFKIEGRLKSPEYVAAVTGVYRKAIDACFANETGAPVTREDWYRLEMTFSRGLSSGWMHGVNHQELVHARFGKKRGAWVGRVERVGRDWVEVTGEVAVAAGDGVVFDTGEDPEREQGGRVFAVKG